MKKKACKGCKFLYDGSECPLCHSAQNVTNWKGRIHFVSLDGKIAKTMDVEKEGEYAIKVN